MDKNTERRHYFNQPFTARYVRVHPITWRGRVSMRLGLIGCQLQGMSQFHINIVLAT